ncbi:MAG: phosphoribosylaminoimidazolesuccinocarboxamide synthase [Pseudomonadota bacterium]
MKTDFLKTSGKVRDIYDLGQTLLLVSTDRLSAFDRHIGNIPDKGIALNQLSAWWFNKTAAIIPNHLIAVPHPQAMQIKKCRVLPIEVVVRGTITGSTNTSLWTLYQQGERHIFGNHLPNGLRKNDKLAQAILTPTSKEQEHDRPLQRTDLANIPYLTSTLWAKIEETAFALFHFASHLLAAKGLLLADTKFEFGLDENNELCLIDELLTSDSSRYWEIQDWQTALTEGREPQAYDKEMLRLWYRQRCDPYRVTTLPEAPSDLITAVSARYRKLYEIITNQMLPLPHRTKI